MGVHEVFSERSCSANKLNTESGLLDHSGQHPGIKNSLCSHILDQPKDEAPCKDSRLLDTVTFTGNDCLLDVIGSGDIDRLGSTDITIHNELHLSQPAENQLFIASIQAKSYWLDKEMFNLIDGVLYRQKPDQDTGHWLSATPESPRESVLYLHHDLPTAGDQGVARIISRLKEKVFWFQMSKDAESYVLSCNVCNQNKKEQGLWKGPINRISSSGTK